MFHSTRSRTMGRTALFGTTFLVLALAGPSFADQPQSQAPGFAQAKAQMVHMRGPGGPGGRGMLPLARLACGENAEADIAAFQANLTSGLDLSADQQALVASIIEKITADSDNIARMCERMERMAERGDDKPGWGRRHKGERHGMMRGHGMDEGMDGDMDGDMDDDDDDDEREYRQGQKPGFWGHMRDHRRGGHEFGGHEFGGHEFGGHEYGHKGDQERWGRHGKRRHDDDRRGQRAGGLGLERILNNPALSDEDRQALEAIAEKLRTAAQEKQKARHEIRGLMMELRHSLTKEQMQTLRNGGFQQFLPQAGDTKA